MGPSIRLSTLLLLLCAISLIFLLVDARKRKKRRKNPTCYELTIPNTIRTGCAPPYVKGEICYFSCKPGCRTGKGAARRKCKVRPARWAGGKGLKCNCPSPCTDSPPDVPNTSDNKNCTPTTYPYRSGTICYYHCIPGYVDVWGQDFKRCVDGRWIGSDLVCDRDDCAAVVCQNGGTCHDGEDSYTCECAVGYEGDHCERDIDDCSSVICHNGGICIDGVNSYRCHCAPGYEGDRCEINIDDCSSVICQNGGICIDGVNSYRCHCAPGYEGDHCETNIDDCYSGICQNGGTCIDDVNSYRCDCASGYEGDHCQTNIDDCSSVICQNGGICIDGVNSYRCHCAPGYEGDHCETSNDLCSSVICQNGGTCIDHVFRYICNCALGFEGDHCETNIDDCSPGICQNGGICIDGVNSYSCRCTHGYRGDHCELRPGRPCTRSPPDVPNTSDDKTCTSTRFPYSAGTICYYQCNPGYVNVSGQDFKECEDGQWMGVDLVCDIDDCSSVICENGGTCIDGVDTYSCDCAPGYFGDHCEIVDGGWSDWSAWYRDYCASVIFQIEGTSIDGSNSEIHDASQSRLQRLERTLSVLGEYWRM
ncbi:fibropellin-1-like [Branchiostoma floridae]|uniref:Fibropellin-1-like n=1 Tax=Branchiostoma floridae TaxID=7739 RepID=A0A9J7KTS8_BRAFL|nr:fibropellin-1-like [Branchiostoma floridae]